MDLLLILIIFRLFIPCCREILCHRCRFTKNQHPKLQTTHEGRVCLLSGFLFFLFPTFIFNNIIFITKNKKSEASIDLSTFVSFHFEIPNVPSHGPKGTWTPPFCLLLSVTKIFSLV